MRTLLRSMAAAGIAIAASGVAVAAQPDPEVDSFVCELSGDCATAEAPGTASEPTPAAPRGARTSSTRGFTFARTRAPGEAASIAPAAPRAGAAAPQRTAAAPARSAPTPGAANLHIDFASGSATLTSGARTRLAKLAAALDSPRLASRRVRIEGHTDGAGPAAANQFLSQRRAQSTADYLVSAGVAKSRLDVVGYGASRPLPGIAASDGANRRVMAVLIR